VLVIGLLNGPDSMEWHVVDALRQLQIDVEYFSAKPGIAGMPLFAQKALTKIANTWLREPERLVESRLLATVDRFAPEMILVILGSQVSPKTIDRLRARTSAPIVCWCQDQMTTLGRQYLLGAEYNAVFVKDRYMQDLFSRMIRSTRFYYLAEACNPRVHRSLELTEQDRAQYGCDVMIAGSLYYYRQEILQALQDEFDLKVWGQKPDWLSYRLKTRHVHREVLGDEKVRAVTAARIALNSFHFAEVDGLNCRAFELAGCGAFQLCTAQPVLAEHFVPGVEIETFDSISDLIEKIRHFLKHADEAAAIARRSQLRAHKDHTYECRLDEIFRIAFA
jgi:spore maturation protein CgeB